MKIIRNSYSWLILGTFVFIGVMAWLSSLPAPKDDADDDPCPETGQMYDRCRGGPLSPFAAGFITAAIVGGFWYAVHIQTHPTERKRDDPQVGKVSEVSWVLAVRNRTNNEVEFLGPENNVAEGDERYEPFVHRMPCSELNSKIDFWGHQLSEKCFCRPDIEGKLNGRDMVIHHIRVD